MSYATPQDIVDRYGEEDLIVAADRDDDEQVDTTAVDRALADASAEIDSYIGERYSVPVSPVPEVLKRVCVDIALYRLAFNAVGNTEERRIRYEDAIKFLKSIAKGDITLGVSSQTDDADGSGAVDNGSATLLGPSRLFTRDSMKDL